METKFFKQCSNLDDLRNRAFRIKDALDLDNPINYNLRSDVEAEYKYLFSSLQAEVNASNKSVKEFSQEEILKKIKPLNLELEVCGKWLWVHGNTKPHRELFKELKLRYSPGKKSWYWRPSKYRSINKEPMDMDEIRKIYGSQQLKLRE